MKTRPVGIDLGTTYSVVAYIDDNGRTQVARNTEGDILTPSVVLFEDSEVIVGKEAKKATALKSGSIAEMVKRDMGKENYTRTIHGEKLHPEVIQACILKKLKDDAIAAIGQHFEVVITVPAYFDEPRRKATADAGEMAGLSVLDIVNEPTAAALAFGEQLGYLTKEGDPREPMKVLVYDLGGGTFDVTLLDLRPGDLRTIATDGDVQLGGHDWDMRLVNYAAEQFQKQHRLDPRQSPASLAALLAAAEEAKHTLTARPKTSLMVRHGGHNTEVPVTREQFEELTEDLLERTAYTTRQVLAASGLTWQQVNRVLLVGGSTRMLMVPQMIEKLTGLTPDRTVNPDEAVARGAAVFAGYLIRGRDPNAKPTFKVVDVNAHSLGIEGIDQRTMRKENNIIIPRNSSLPAKVTKKFVTKTEDQHSIVVQVLEGESKNPTQCSGIGRAVLRNLPERLPKGWPIEVTYEYLTNGRLDVKAHIPGTSKGIELELQREQSLTSERIGRWKKVLAEAKGFDAFEGLLDEVVHAQRVEKKKAMSAPTPTAPAVRKADPSKPSAKSDDDDDADDNRDLSAASQAFAEVETAIAATKAAEPVKAAAVSAKKDDGESSAKKPEPATVPKPKGATAGSSSSAASSLGKPTSPAGPKPPTPGQRYKASPTPPANSGRAASILERDPLPIPPERSGPPSETKMWIVNVVAFLVVSVLSLLIFYYAVAWFSKAGNFLNLPLPGLPPKKAPATPGPQKTTLLAPGATGKRSLPVDRGNVAYLTFVKSPSGEVLIKTENHLAHRHWSRRAGMLASATRNLATTPTSDFRPLTSDSCPPTSDT